MAILLEKKRKSLLLVTLLAMAGSVALFMIISTKGRDESSVTVSNSEQEQQEEQEEILPDVAKFEVEKEPELELFQVFNSPVFKKRRTLGTLMLHSDTNRTSFFLSINVTLDADTPFNSVDDEITLCFTKNIYLFEKDLINSDYNVNTTHDSIYCVNNLKMVSLARDFPLRKGFRPETFGAAALLSHDKSLYLGNCIYAEKYQNSLYPTLTTILEKTTDDYDISGSIVVSGQIKRDFSTGDVIDVPVLNFKNIKLYPNPPDLFLYLTNRAGWYRFNKNDIFIHIPGAENDYVDGSFSQTGTYKMEWPYDHINILDYQHGNWYLWCRTFEITLAGGALLNSTVI